MTTTSKKTKKTKATTKVSKAKTKPAKVEPSPEPAPEDTPEAPPPPPAPEPEPKSKPEQAPEPEPKPKVEAPGGPDGDPRVKGPKPPPDRKVAGPAGEFGVPSEEPTHKAGEPGVRLKNLRNKPIFVSLDHEIYCAAAGRCTCSTRDVARETLIERGSKAQRMEYKRILMPRSVMIPAMGVSEPLHAAVKKCPDVAQKLHNRPQKIKIMPV